MDSNKQNGTRRDMDMDGAYGARPGSAPGTHWAFGPGGYDPMRTIGDLETMRPQEDEGTMMLAGRYRVLRRLGEGGMGSVWLASDLKLDGRAVAVKMLPAVLAGKKGAFRQVKQEALMAMKLSHPNIATVRAFEEDDGGIPFLVMDYIEGKGLDDLIAEKGALPEAEALKLLEPVAAALDYAHSQGVVHRDVKPANVMVRKDGTPFVLDFGIAREIQETMTRVTGKLSSGTLMYMSPEQLHGLAPKAAQDVYSFAAMAYECLGGRPPFATGQIEYRIDHDAPEPLAKERAGEALRNGILAGLAKEPEGRPESCGAVLGGMRKESETKTSHFVPPAEKRFTVPANGNRGRRAWWGGGLALVLVLVVAVACWLVAGERQHDQDKEEEEANWLALEAKTKAASVVHMDRGQGFGERIDEVRTKQAQGEDARREKRFGKAKECFEAAIAAAEWCQRNTSLREDAVKARDTADTAKRKAETVGGERLGVTAWRRAEKQGETAESAFARAHFREAAVAWNAAGTAYGEAEAKARTVQVEQELVAAREAKARGAWDEVVASVARVLALDPGSAEAKVLNDEALEAKGAGEQLKRKLAEAFGAMERREWDGAIAAADGVLALDPGSEVAKTIKAEALAAKETWERVNRELDAARGAKDRGEWKEVVAAAGRVLAMEPENSEAKTLKAEAEKKLAEPPKKERREGETMVIDLPGGAAMTMVWCPSGQFLMGSPSAEVGREPNETLHRVTLTRGFWLAKTEVTQAQWRSVMGSNPSAFKGDDLPVESVSWKDCMDFCRAVGNGLHLPTEAQWEYACRAGSTGAFAGTGSMDDMGWYEDNSGNRTRPVGWKKPNAWGLCDMHGNVWEWCADKYGKYPDVAVTDPSGEESEDSRRIYRGGAWHGTTRFNCRSCRSANRSFNNPSYTNNYLGFRPCMAEPAGAER